MSDADEKLRAQAEAATTGPWHVTGESDHGYGVGAGKREFEHPIPSIATEDAGDCWPCSQPDAVFIAAADPQTVLALLDRLADVGAENERLTKERDRARAGLDGIENPQPIEQHVCPECQGWDLTGHVWTNHARTCSRRRARWFDVERAEAERDQALQALQEVTRQRDLHRSLRAAMLQHIIDSGAGPGDLIQVAEILGGLLVSDRAPTAGDHQRADEVWAYLYQGGPTPAVNPAALAGPVGVPAEQPELDRLRVCEHGWVRAHNQLSGPGHRDVTRCPGPVAEPLVADPPAAPNCSTEYHTAANCPSGLTHDPLRSLGLDPQED